jgi:Nucleotidyl transferase AbiEii toxin, Type IV TA system
VTEKRKLTNTAASVHARLLSRARQENRPFNELLQYFAMERFLYRFSRSPYAENLILKGALMLRVWEAPLSRPTMDIDMLGSVDNAIENLIAIVRECLQTEVADDDLQFDTCSLIGERIALDAKYEGVRLRFVGFLGKARFTIQLDIGFSDTVIPRPVWIEYPQLLDFGQPRLLGYTPESAIAEKLQAMVALDIANTRMKDFYDVWLLCCKLPFQGNIFCQALQTTFQLRSTPLPAEAPLAFTSRFYENPTKQTQWSAFLRKSRLGGEIGNLGTIVQKLESFLMPPVSALTMDQVFEMNWEPGGPWEKAQSEHRSGIG